jgi:hypothetical protein
MNLDLKGGKHRQSFGRARWREAQAETWREERARRERESIEAAIRTHAEWLTAQANSTIPNTWAIEAARQSNEAARSEATLLAEIRLLKLRDRFSAIKAHPPIRPPLRGKDGGSTDAPTAVPTAVPQSDREA